MIGKVKVTFNRARNYIAILNTLMIGYLFLKDTGFQWWYLIIIFLFVIFLYFDNKYILGKERDYIWTRQGEVKNMLNDIKYIKEEIDGYISREVCCSSKRETKSFNGDNTR